MSYTFEKVTVKKWEVTAVYKNFMKMDLVSLAIKKKVEKCEICSNKLNGEYVHLATVKGRVNHLICDACCATAEANDVHIRLKRHEPEEEPDFVKGWKE